MKTIKLISTFIILLILSSCVSKPDNMPYEPDTPLPNNHNGHYVSKIGSFDFNGDGKTIIVNMDKGLAELFELEEGTYEGSYIFLSGELPPHKSEPIRYDVAHELEIDLNINGEIYSKVFNCGLVNEDSKTATVGTNVISEDRIPLLFEADSNIYNVIFVRES